MCGWCSYQTQKAVAEDDSRPARIWNPQQNLEVEEKKVITPEEFLRIDLAVPLDRQLIARLHENPKDIYGLSPRQFEEFVADLLARSGFEVKLGPRGRDDGVDVFAERATGLGPELIIVQVKKYREDRKVGQPTIKQLHADVSDRDASKGLIVTSSSFSRDAKKYIDLYKYKLTGKDFDDLRAWIAEIRRKHGK
jgi:restriction endonuclease Mrr